MIRLNPSKGFQFGKDKKNSKLPVCDGLQKQTGPRVASPGFSAINPAFDVIPI